MVEAGSGPTVVFSHSTLTWPYEFRHMARALREGYRVVLVDHLGFGLSGRPRGANYSTEAHAHRFEQLLSLLSLDSYHLVAHDYGGPFALDFALKHPEKLRSVTLLNTFAWGFGDSVRTRLLASVASSGFFRWLYRRFNFSFVIAKSAWGKFRRSDAFAPYLPLFRERDDRELVLFALARCMRGSFAFDESLWERRDALAKVPMQIIWGLRDTAFPPSAHAKLTSGYPHAEVRLFEDSGHWPHEEEPERAIATHGEFLNKVEVHGKRLRERVD